MHQLPDYKWESEMCDRIRALSDEINLLYRQGKDITEARQQLELALKKFDLFRRR